MRFIASFAIHPTELREYGHEEVLHDSPRVLAAAGGLCLRG